MKIYTVEYGDSYFVSKLASCKTEDVAKQYIEKHAKTVGYGNIGKNFYWNGNNYICDDFNNFYSFFEETLLDKTNIEKYV